VATYKKGTTVASSLYSAENLPFYRARVRECLVLAEASRSVPSIKIRLEALARKYQSWIDDLEGAAHDAPPLAPANYASESRALDVSDQFENVRGDEADQRFKECI
jgi:hypothetical protein